MKTQVIAMGGGALPAELDNLRLVKYFLGQTGKKYPKVCFIGTAGGDAESHRLRFYAGFGRFGCRTSDLPLFARTPRNLESFVLAHDAIFVGGGNTRSMLAVWRDWGLDGHLRTAWERGILLGGVSAGAICWFEQGITDSVAGPLTAMDGLGWLPGSCCPHYDSEPLRRPAFRRMVANGTVAGGVAADDFSALHYVDGKLLRVVSGRRGARAYRLKRSGARAIEKPLPLKRLFSS